MGSRARDYVVVNYSLESCLRNFEDMYRSPEGRVSSNLLGT